MALLAQVTPLTPVEFAVGLSLLLVTGGLGLAMWWRQPAASDEDRLRYNPYRLWSIFLLMLLVVLMGIGLVIDPRVRPSTFVLVWFLSLVLLFLLIMTAFADMATVHRQARAERKKIFAESVRQRESENAS